MQSADVAEIRTHDYPDTIHLKRHLGAANGQLISAEQETGEEGTWELKRCRERGRRGPVHGPGPPVKHYLSSSEGFRPSVKLKLVLGRREHQYIIGHMGRPPRPTLRHVMCVPTQLASIKTLTISQVRSSCYGLMRNIIWIDLVPSMTSLSRYRDRLARRRHKSPPTSDRPADIRGRGEDPITCPPAAFLQSDFGM
ncbi:hypothetical protein J6590_032213 [Homalodisca vitripennis]|nr:hypothetical protein J6590_032213 [Homalodisca vitripennis]